MRRVLLFVALIALAGAANAHDMCEEEDGTCLGRRHVCFNQIKWRTPAGCSCKDKWPCEWKPTCRGLPNYHCVDSTHFCLRHRHMRCAPGTWCQTTGTNRITPCWRTKPPASCSHNMRCTSDKSYCLDGHVQLCHPGHRCFGFGPCVKKV